MQVETAYGTERGTPSDRTGAMEGSALASLPAHRVVWGNAGGDGLNGGRGWFVGRFMPPETGPCRAGAVEVKWGVHHAGERRPSVVGGSDTVSLALLVSGRFTLKFPDVRDDVVLRQQGDYVVYGPGVPHTWFADEDSTIITIRWPAD
jgi:hypothetical protein